MDKKQIAKLAEISYINNVLDGETVQKIVARLNNKESREYLKALKRRRKKIEVYIDYALELTEENKKKFKDIFPDKKVIFRNNPGLIMGIRITEDDKVYNFNISNELSQIKEFLDKSL